MLAISVRVVEIVKSRHCPPTFWVASSAWQARNENENLQEMHLDDVNTRSVGPCSQQELMLRR